MADAEGLEVKSLASLGKVPLPSVEDLAKVRLKTKTGQRISAGDVWKDQPVVAVVLRRPGCVLCREEALNIWDVKTKLDELGVKPVVLFHEWLDHEIEGFHPEFWAGELYHDFDKGFYAALGGGKPRTRSMAVALAQLMNPLSRAGKNFSRAKKRVGNNYNMKGDGLTLGGLFVIGRGNSGVNYMFIEKTFGDHAPIEEVLEAAAAASKMAKS